MRRFSFMGLLLSLLFLFFACRSQTQAPEPVQGISRTPSANNTALSGWELNWQKTLAQAKKEGKVIIHTGVSPMTRTNVAKGFKDKYGIEVEFIAGSGGLSMARILMERRAGIYAVDLVITGSTSLITDLKAAGALEPIEPVLMLPEVTDLKYWYENKYQFADRDALIMYLGLSPRNAVFGNSNLVRMEEIKSHLDLLNPKWKGKIAFNDPTVAGSGLGEFTVMKIVHGVDFLKNLAKQEPVFTRNDRLRVEWITQGKYLIGLGGSALSRDFANEGAPILHFELDDAVDLIPGFGALGKVKNPPFSNAAIVFINWLLSKEGQTIFSRWNDKQSIRTDVPTDFMDERNIRKPGVKYLRTADEEIVMQKDENVRLAREIYKDLLK